MADRDFVDDLLHRARATPPAPEADFMARVLADAVAAQPKAAGLIRPAMSSARRGLLARMIAALGGAAALAGIGSAAMAGLVIGYVQPDQLLTLTDTVGITAAGESLELLPGFDTLLTEE